MSLDLIIKAAKFIEYVEETKAHGGVPMDSSTYYWSIVYVPLQDHIVDLNTSCDSRVLEKSHKSSSCEKSKVQINERSNLRKNHNSLEKERRAVMKERVEQLRNMLLCRKDKKMSIVCILKKAEGEVQSLKSECNALEKELNILEIKQMGLQNTLEQLKMENRVRNNHHLNSVNDCSDGESTATASECDDDSDEEEVVDQIKKAEVISDETKDHHMAGAQKQFAVLHCSGSNASVKVTSNSEPGSILFTRLSEASNNNIVKKVRCKVASTFRKFGFLQNVPPGKKFQLLNSSLNARLVSVEKPFLQIHKGSPTIKNTVTFSCDNSRESKVELCSQKSASQPQEQLTLGEKESISNSSCKQSLQIDTHSNIKMSVKDNKCKLNPKCISEHSNKVKSVPQNSAKTLMNSSETGLRPLSRTLQQILNSPLERGTVIRGGGESLLKSVSAPTKVCVAFRSSIPASHTKNCTQGTLISSNGKSFSVVTHVKGRDVEATCLISSSLANGNLQL